MNNVSVFFTTKVQNTGFLSAVGNFFMAPTRFLFSGKTINIERDPLTYFPKSDGRLAKVTSFFVSQPAYAKRSKQDPKLTSEPWGYTADLLFVPIIMAALFIPFAVIGSIFKGLAYFSPLVRQVHSNVKAKLTPTNKTIGAVDEPLPQAELQQILFDTLMSGQKIGALTLYVEAGPMNDDCLKLIKKLNPSKVVLVGDWTKNNFNIQPHLLDSTESPRNREKTSWDISAVMPVPPRRSQFDYQAAARSANIVPTVEAALSSPLPFFGARHKVYVVNPGPEVVAANGERSLGCS
jgi:hypothetical protein